MYKKNQMSTLENRASRFVRVALVHVSYEYE